mmetsp:Transcript_9280/g.27014  ORF Transcript_9280/g.27014 Transcript_9280/m.27014 type:complete len:228 (+) Transcript_9280:619-1302(+)
MGKHAGGGSSSKRGRAPAGESGRCSPSACTSISRTMAIRWMGCSAWTEKVGSLFRSRRSMAHSSPITSGCCLRQNSLAQPVAWISRSHGCAARGTAISTQVGATLDTCSKSESMARANAKMCARSAATISSSVSSSARMVPSMDSIIIIISMPREPASSFASMSAICSSTGTVSSAMWHAWLVRTRAVRPRVSIAAVPPPGCGKNLEGEGGRKGAPRLLHQECSGWI